MFRKILDYLGYIQTWIWLWGIAGISAICVLAWAFLTRLPAVVAFVLALGTGVLLFVGLETLLIIYEKIQRMRGQRYRNAVAALDGLRTRGVVLRNRVVSSDTEVRVFVADFGDFEDEVLTVIKGTATHTDISWFRDLHEWTVPHGVEAYNDKHALMKATLNEKLRRMLHIAHKLEAKIE